METAQHRRRAPRHRRKRDYGAFTPAKRWMVFALATIAITAMPVALLIR